MKENNTSKPADQGPQSQLRKPHFIIYVYNFTQYLTNIYNPHFDFLKLDTFINTSNFLKHPEKKTFKNY